MNTRLHEVLHKLEDIEKDLNSSSTFLSIEGVHYGYFIRDGTIDGILREILRTGLRKRIADLKKATLQND